MGIRTGVIGAGIVSENNHLPALDRNPRTELAAVCDVDEGRARSAAADYGVRPYTDADALLSDEALDWVHVATPVQTHLDLALRAVEAGVPVAIQKPATVTLDELAELASAVEESDVHASVVHNWLFYPVVREVRRRIDAEELGEIRAVETTFTGEGRPDETYRGSWVFDLPGGDFEEGIPHPIYLTLALGGYPRDEADVDVLTRSVGEYDDAAYDGMKVQYVGDGGALCSITCLSGSARNSGVRVYGSEKSLFVDISSMSIEEHDVDEGPYHFFNERVRRNATASLSALGGLANNLVNSGKSAVEDRFDLHRERSADGHYHLFNEAAKALERGTQPPVDLERSRWTLTLMERVREAA